MLFHGNYSEDGEGDNLQNLHDTAVPVPVEVEAPVEEEKQKRKPAYFKSKFWDFIVPKKTAGGTPSRPEKVKKYDQVQVRGFMEKQKEMRRQKEKQEEETRKRDAEKRKKRLQEINEKSRDIMKPSLIKRETPPQLFNEPPQSMSVKQSRTKSNLKPMKSSSVHSDKNTDSALRTSLLLHEFENIVHNECLNVFNYHSEKMSSLSTCIKVDKAVETTDSLFDGHEGSDASSSLSTSPTVDYPFETTAMKNVVSSAGAVSAYKLRNHAAAKIQSAYRGYRLRKLLREGNSLGQNSRERRRRSFYGASEAPIDQNTKNLLAWTPSKHSLSPRTPDDSSRRSYIPPPPGYSVSPSVDVSEKSNNSTCSRSVPFSTTLTPSKHLSRFEEPFPAEAIRKLLQSSPPGHASNTTPKRRLSLDSRCMSSGHSKYTRLAIDTDRRLSSNFESPVPLAKPFDIDTVDLPVPTFSTVLREKIRILQEKTLRSTAGGNQITNGSPATPSSRPEQDQRKLHFPKQVVFQYDSDSTSNHSFSTRNAGRIRHDYIGPDANEMQRAYELRKSRKSEFDTSIPREKTREVPKSAPHAIKSNGSTKVPKISSPSPSTTTVETDMELKGHEEKHIRKYQSHLSSKSSSDADFGSSSSVSLNAYPIPTIELAYKAEKERLNILDKALQATLTLETAKAHQEAQKDAGRAQTLEIQSLKLKANAFNSNTNNHSEVLVQLAKCQAEQLRATAEVTKWVSELRKSSVEQEASRKQEQPINMAAIVIAAVEEAKKYSLERELLSPQRAQAQPQQFPYQCKILIKDQVSQFPSESSNSETPENAGKMKMKAKEKGTQLLESQVRRLHEEQKQRLITSSRSDYNVNSESSDCSIKGGSSYSTNFEGASLSETEKQEGIEIDQLVIAADKSENNSKQQTDHVVTSNEVSGNVEAFNRHLIESQVQRLHEEQNQIVTSSSRSNYNVNSEASVCSIQLDSSYSSNFEGGSLSETEKYERSNVLAVATDNLSENNSGRQSDHVTPDEVSGNVEELNHAEILTDDGVSCEDSKVEEKEMLGINHTPKSSVEPSSKQEAEERLTEVEEDDQFENEILTSISSAAAEDETLREDSAKIVEEPLIVEDETGVLEALGTKKIPDKHKVIIEDQVSQFRGECSNSETPQNASRMMMEAKEKGTLLLESEVRIHYGEQNQGLISSPSDYYVNSETSVYSIKLDSSYSAKFEGASQTEQYEKSNQIVVATENLSENNSEQQTDHVTPNEVNGNVEEFNHAEIRTDEVVVCEDSKIEGKETLEISHTLKYSIEAAFSKKEAEEKLPEVEEDGQFENEPLTSISSAAVEDESLREDSAKIEEEPRIIENETPVLEALAARVIPDKGKILNEDPVSQFPNVSSNSETVHTPQDARRMKIESEEKGTQLLESEVRISHEEQNQRLISSTQSDYNVNSEASVCSIQLDSSYSTNFEGESETENSERSIQLVIAAEKSENNSERQSDHVTPDEVSGNVEELNHAEMRPDDVDVCEDSNIKEKELLGITHTLKYSIEAFSKKETEEKLPEGEEHEWFEDELVTSSSSAAVEDETLREEAAKIVEEQRIIENEIRVLEALAAREIPDKPPPPYSPPSSSGSSSLSLYSRFFSTAFNEQKLRDMIKDEVEKGWSDGDQPGTFKHFDLDLNNSTNSLPYNSEATNISDNLTIVATCSFDALMLDTVRKIIPEVLQIESEIDKSFIDKIRPGSLALEAQRQRIPHTKEVLTETTFRKFLEVIPTELATECISASSGLSIKRRQSKWSSRPRDMVDEVLVEELVDEDREWTEYWPEEILVADRITELILKRAIHEVADDIQTVFG